MDDDVTIDYERLGETVSRVVCQLIKKRDLRDTKLGVCIDGGHIGGLFRDNFIVPDVWRREKEERRSAVTAGEQTIVPILCSEYNDIDLSKIILAEPNYFTDRAPIVFILESPHFNEYRLSGNNAMPKPIAPAQNDTGKKIDALISRSPNFFAQHPLLLCNPVPWQASLAHFHSYKLHSGDGRAIRNNVWKAIWKFSQDDTHPIQDNFLQRMDSYHPAVIINACTGKSSYGLWSLVQKALGERQSISSHHPSSSHFNQGYQDKLIIRIRKYMTG
jgi:hypothetical protein